MVKLCCSDENGNIYTNLEITDMHFIHGFADENTKEACSLHQELFPGHRIQERSR
jgi:hypothetical protein